MRSRFCRGYFSIELAMLYAVVAAALLGMASYTWRAMCGNWRKTGDSFSDGRQYEHCVTLVKNPGDTSADVPEDCKQNN